MNKLEALVALDSANTSESQSRLNRSIAQEQAIRIVRKVVESLPEDFGRVPDWIEKRVNQVSQNRKRPS